MTQQKVYIQADKQKDGAYVATELADSLESLLDQYEYGDVLENEYQIWEYPSGKIYSIKPDRKLSQSDHYSSSWTVKGVVWLPLVDQSGPSPEQVARAYKLLSSVRPKKSVLSKLVEFIKRVE